MTLYNLSQNKIAKQCFHTLFKQTCVILTSIKLSIKLWKEIIMIIIYFKNKSSIIALNHITFYET